MLNTIFYKVKNRVFELSFFEKILEDGRGILFCFSYLRLSKIFYLFFFAIFCSITSRHSSSSLNKQTKSFRLAKTFLPLLR
ncbi:MAG: hypothetical protein MRERV_32c036 [Mycoplasmataceae bacterium RV_VA103A]|nr:MAG: hypothetical protein MRERV_32c036 [Mycoplasmataceae bacterium RV_VA103A]